MPVTHLTMFYESRFSTHVRATNPANNPNTELTEVPTKAEIRYKDENNRVVDSNEFDAPNGKGYETAQFFISRAMLDPDAVVVPA